MKNYFFPALVWMLTLSHVVAQKTLSPGVKPYTDNWTHSVKRLFNHAGFDLPAEAVNKVSSRSPLQLDSTKTYSGYDLNAPGDSTPLFRSDYEYPSPDSKIEINYQFDNGGWQKINRTTLVSDDQQRLVEAIAEAYDPVTQSYQFDSRIEVFPHGDSQVLIDSFFTYLWDSTITDWHIILVTRNTFDDQDRLHESVSTVDYFGDPLIFTEEYSYDSIGDNHLIEEFAIIGSDTFPSSRTDIVYTDHRPIEETVSVSDGFNFIPQNRDNYAYTTFGALRLHMSFIWDDSIGNFRLTQRIEYGFDGEQRVSSKETTIVTPGAWDVRELVTYAYAEDENLSLEMFFHWDDDLFDWVLETKKHYYYNGLVAADPEPNPVLALQIVPNPTVDAVRLTLDNEAIVQVFGPAGQLLQSRLVQPGQMLDLASLPAGVYQMTAQQGADFYSGRVVKQ